MKRRIISTILVVVMLALTLVGCGYSYTKDDLSKYASYAEGYDKAAFDAALLKLVIEDGEFGAPTVDGVPNPKRVEKVLENIYTSLVGKVDTKDTDLQKTDGKIDKNDLLYFCYYATYVDSSSNTVTVYPSQMKQSAATSVKLGSSELKGALAKGVQEKLLALIGEAGEMDFADYAYSTNSSNTEKAEEGDVAYISYTETNVSSGDAKVYNYVKVTIGDSAHVVGEKLKDATVGTAISEFKNADESMKYTGAKVLWIVEDAGTKITFDHTLEEKVSTKDLAVGTTSVEIPKDTVLTYHVFPVYYYEVAEYSAEEVLKSLIKTLTKDSLECLADCEDLIKTFNEKVTALTEAEKAYDDAVSAKEKAETALTNAEKAAKKAGEAAGKTGDELTAYIADDATVKTAKADLETKTGDVTTKETKKGEAETARDDAMKAIFKKVGADDEAAGKTKIENEYKESIKDSLVEKYNAEIKENLASAVWELMKKSVKVNSYPKRGVKEVYDRMYESHEYTFYTESDSTTKESYYSIYSGSFKEYLKTTMKADSFKEAKEMLRAEAEAYVEKIIIVYFVAEQFGQTYTKDEIKDYKNDEEGDYNYNEYYQGETNALVAYQFDKLMNYFLESETDEETGNVTYNDRIAFTTTEHDDEDEHNH